MHDCFYGCDCSVFIDWEDWCLFSGVGGWWGVAVMDTCATAGKQLLPEVKPP